MRLLLRCDATPVVGAGQLIRGLAIAEAAAGRGHETVLSGTVEGDWVLEQVREAGVRVVEPADSAADLSEAAKALGARVVHVGQLSLDGDIKAGLERAGALLSRIDPPGQRLPTAADLLIEPSLTEPGRTGAVAGPGPDGATVVTGPDYAPVRAAVVAARERRQFRAGGLGDRLRVLLILGGPPTAPMVVSLVRDLVDTDLALDVLVVAPTASSGRVAEALSTRRVRVLATGLRADLPRLMADHDLAVCVAGAAAWELCCIGTPMALVALDEEHRATARDFAEAEVAVDLGGPEQLAEATGVLRALLRDGLRRAQMSATATRLVDGRGAERIVTLMEQLAGG